MTQRNGGLRLLESGLLVADWQADQRASVLSVGSVGVGVVLSRDASGSTHPAAEGFNTRVEKHGNEIGALVCTYRRSDLEVPLLVAGLGENSHIHGVLVARPAPPDAIAMLKPRQDIDGATPASPYPPALMTGMFHLVDEAVPDLAGRRVTVAGAGGTVGSQVMSVLERRGITAVGIDPVFGHSDADLRTAIAETDVLFTAMRQPGKLTEEWLHDGLTVFDATVEPVDVEGRTQMWGDVHRSVYTSEMDLTLNRVPGVIGPLATCGLFNNALFAAHAE